MNRATANGRSSALGKLGVLALLALAALAIACGGEPEAKPSGNAMGRDPSRAQEAEALAPTGPNQAPTISKVELRPKAPVPGDRIVSSVTAIDQRAIRSRSLTSGRSTGV